MVTDSKKRENLVMAVVPAAKDTAWERTRAFNELPAQDSINGVTEVAKLTAWARVQDNALEPVMQALLSLRKKVWDPTQIFMIVDDARHINWMTLPRRSYASFEEFYSLELEPTWGKWSDLQDTWNRIARGEITPEQGAREVKDRAQVYQQRDQQDAASKRPVGTNQYSEGVSNAENDRNTRPVGTTIDYALRRLRKDRADLHARVLAGELSAHAAMIEAGFRKRRSVVARPSGLTRLRRDWQRATAEERDTFWHEISKDRT